MRYNRGGGGGGGGSIQLLPILFFLAKSASAVIGSNWQFLFMIYMV